MPTKANIEVSQFNKGFITEANPLNFPEGASLDEVNMRLLPDGTRERRLGLDVERNGAFYATGMTDEDLRDVRISYHDWPMPNNDPNLHIGCIQIGSSLWFIDVTKPNPSAHILNQGNSISAPVSKQVALTSAYINGYLVLTCTEFDDIVLFEYDSENDIVSTKKSPIFIRDFIGVADGLTPDERPNTLTPNHHYNLANQGWLDSVQTVSGDNIMTDVATLGFYPSNSDIVTTGLVPDLTSPDVYLWRPDIWLANSPAYAGEAPKGHYIISPFWRSISRTNVSGISGIVSDTDNGRIGVCAAHAGRIFYAGVISDIEDEDIRSPNFSGTVFFSQIATSIDKLIKCYQEADPTSPIFSEVLPTDGGYIHIPECSVIIRLLSSRGSLFVFAKNGVWEIAGGENGFTATEFQVNKISNIAAMSPYSILEVNGAFIYWAREGIYRLARNESGVWQNENLTLNTVQRWYNSIPDNVKEHVKGFYDHGKEQIRWLYFSPWEKKLGHIIDNPNASSIMPGTCSEGC